MSRIGEMMSLNGQDYVDQTRQYVAVNQSDYNMSLRFSLGLVGGQKCVNCRIAGASFECRKVKIKVPKKSKKEICVIELWNKFERIDGKA